MGRLCLAAGTRTAAAAGAEIAADGGNAVDAAIAAMIVSMCTDIGIMSPGCGVFVTLWPGAGDPCVIDGYAAMPGRGLGAHDFDAATHEVVFDYGGATRQRVGYGTVAVPGGFAGLALASQNHGRLPWRRLLEPAINRVEHGFPLSGGAVEFLGFTHQAIYSWHAETRRLLHRADGSPPGAGDSLSLPDLAATLRQIAADPETLYRGELGRRIAAGVRAAGGALSCEDLQGYRALVRPALRARIGDWDVATNPPPALGGACLAAMLLILDRLADGKHPQQAVAHMVDAQRAVLDFRARHLDGVFDTLEPEVERLLDFARAGGARLHGAPSTSHVSAVDRDGLACAITASAGYGCGAMVDGTGFWLNNSLGELDLHTRGLAGLAPGSRLASNMAPTVARRRSDGALLAIGSPGASRITTAIAQVLANFALRGMDLEQAVGHPRLHVELDDNRRSIAFEPGLAPPAPAGLKPRPFAAASMYFGGVQAAFGSPRDGLFGVADARRGGHAVSV